MDGRIIGEKTKRANTGVDVKTVVYAASRKMRCDVSMKLMDSFIRFSYSIFSQPQQLILHISIIYILCAKKQIIEPTRFSIHYHNGHKHRHGHKFAMAPGLFDGLAIFDRVFSATLLASSSRNMITCGDEQCVIVKHFLRYSIWTHVRPSSNHP